ncbi:MAG: RNA-binding S4 domain-containing protein [Alphaproteobacteria bacterium]
MPEEALRADKWLWYARFFKTRSLATKVCNAGKLRASGELVSKAHHKVKPGDVLTFPQGRHVRVIKVISLATRRGPAAEAQALYEDLKPPSPEARLPRTDGARAPAARAPGTGRPTKQDRRALDKLRSES